MRRHRVLLDDSAALWDSYAMVLTPFADTTQAMPGSGDRGGEAGHAHLGASRVCLLLMQGIVQETFALLLRRQLGGECLAEFMQIFCVMCSPPYQNFGDRANVFGQAVFDNLEHSRTPMAP